MKTSDLRLGNLIYFTQDETNITVCELTHLIHFSKPEYKDSCKPIPITEEWLVKFGFSRKDKFSMYYNPSLKNTSFWISPENDHYQFGRWECDTKLYFVHQLQNLYFALTGEELILK